MRTRPSSTDRRQYGRLEGVRWPLAMYVGIVSVALGGVCSFGYLMFRSRDHSDAGDLPAFVAAQEAVRSSGRIELWRGFPRWSESSVQTPIVMRTFGGFEEAPVQLSTEDGQWLQTFCSYEPHFWQMPPNTYKLCGGFHADWSIVFLGRGRTAEFSFCFGCGEVKILVDGHEPLHLDFSSPFELQDFLAQPRFK